MDLESTFDQAGDRENIRILMRICREFDVYISERIVTAFPSFEDADYIIGSIRSGSDSFFEVIYLLKTLTIVIETTKDLNSDKLPVMVKTYKNLSQILFNKNCSREKRLSAMIDLWRIHFLFVANVVNFPTT